MGRPADLAAALLDLADLACAAGSPIERALIAARGALQLARQHGFRALEAAALLALAETYQRGGRLEPAAVSAAEARRACQQTDDLLVHQRWARWEAAGRRDEGTGGREARVPAFFSFEKEGKLRDILTFDILDELEGAKRLGHQLSHPASW